MKKFQIISTLTDKVTLDVCGSLVFSNQVTCYSYSAMMEKTMAYVRIIKDFKVHVQRNQ